MKRLDRERLLRLVRYAHEKQLRELEAQKRRLVAFRRRKNDVGYAVPEVDEPFLEDTLTLFARTPNAPRASGMSKRRVVTCPRVFTLIDNPAESIDALHHVVNVITDQDCREIIIDLRYVEKTDICANAVLSALMLSKGSNVEKIDLRQPTDPEVREIVRATGLPKVFGLEAPVGHSEFIQFGLVPSDVISSTAKKSSVKELQATKLVDFLDECYGVHGYKLSDETSGQLSQLITEALGNFEDHSGNARWWINAYLRTRPGTLIADCHVTLFNIGRTIADTMSGVDPESEVGGLCQRVLSELKRGRHISDTKGYTEAEVYTLLALQPRFTSKPLDSIAGKDRGNGTVRIMEAFFSVGDTADGNLKPKMAIISGSTQILFTQELSRKNSGADFKQIAFNASNSLFEPPDKRNVHRFASAFPGTVLSLRFYIDPKHLETVTSHVKRTDS